MHRSILYLAIDNFSRSQQRFVSNYLKTDTGERVYQLEAPLEEPPARVLPIIGDALFNYRATLDHLMWALVIVSGTKPSERTQFPIVKDKNSFHDSNRGGKMLNGVSPLIKEVIECYQPYTDVNEYDGEILGELNGLNNIDKHRHLHLVTGHYEGTYNQDEKDLQAWREIQNNLFLNIGHVGKGAILAKIPPQYANLNFEPSFELAFSETNEFAPGHRVRGTIQSIGTTVECILDQFERLFFFKDSSALGRMWHDFSGNPYFSGSDEQVWGAPIISTTYNERLPAFSTGCLTSVIWFFS